jgi:redox-sensitive bicupin YhaK (pirin superfamily)
MNVWDLRLKAAEITEDAVVLMLPGEPLNEAIVGHGPFIMNTRAEIMQAMQDYNNGKFGQIVAVS